MGIRISCWDLISYINQGNKIVRKDIDGEKLSLHTEER